MTIFDFFHIFLQNYDIFDYTFIFKKIQIGCNNSLKIKNRKRGNQLQKNNSFHLDKKMTYM